MNDAQWFKFWQPSLLGLVNTEHGRDLFSIEHDLPTIVEIAPWYIKWTTGLNEYQSEFHSKAVYNRRLLHRWDEIASDLRSPLLVPRYVYFRGQKLPVPMGGTDTIFRPDADTESNSVDGHIGFAGLDDRIDWAAATTDDGSAVTQTRDSHGTINATAFQRSGTWEDFTRAFLLFNTASIGSDVVSAAVLAFTSSQTTTSATEQTWSVVSSTPASNTALVAADYDNVGSTSFGSIEADSGVTTDSSTYNAITLNGSGEAAISTSGVTKLAMRWYADLADAEPSSGTNGCQIQMLSADTSGTSKDPKLTVTHAAPAFIPEVRFF